MVILRKAVPGVSTQSLQRFTGRTRRAAGLQGPVAVLVTGNREMRTLNRRFRGKDEPTDVLSFPSPRVLDLEPRGDIVISADIAGANALRLGHRPAQELKVLILHGILHLAGFDHESDNGEMARLEARLRRELGLPDGLISRAQSLHSSHFRPDRKPETRKRKSARRAK